MAVPRQEQPRVLIGVRVLAGVATLLGATAAVWGGSHWVMRVVMAMLAVLAAAAVVLPSKLLLDRRVTADPAPGWHRVGQITGVVAVVAFAAATVFSALDGDTGQALRNASLVFFLAATCLLNSLATR